MKCVICDDKKTGFQWSDTHGVGVCCNCGMPYTIYHYENDKHINKKPSPAIKEEWIPIARKYWHETGRRVFPASYDMGTLRSGDRSYSGATLDDVHKFDEWLDAHEDELPKKKDGQEAI